VSLAKRGRATEGALKEGDREQVIRYLTLKNNPPRKKEGCTAPAAIWNFEDGIYCCGGKGGQSTREKNKTRERGEKRYSPTDKARTASRFAAPPNER